MLETTAVELAFADTVGLTTPAPLPERWNWPRSTPLPRPGDDIVMAATPMGARPLRATVRRTEFVITPEPPALSNLFEAISETAAVSVRLRLHLALAAEASEA